MVLGFALATASAYAITLWWGVYLLPRGYPRNSSGVWAKVGRWKVEAITTNPITTNVFVNLIISYFLISAKFWRGKIAISYI
jgi:hypothetical protein